jgi:hypothetical protein
MKQNKTKNHPTIGCCGIDCGLCPRFHTDGISRCPGCAGENFFEKHPSCSIITCCFITKGLETCGTCSEFICRKMQNWDAADSFVTHRNCISNLKNIKEKGLPAVIHQQEKRLLLLENLLQNYDDGRSKSFFCLSAALLPTDSLGSAIADAACNAEILNDPKRLAKHLKEAFMKAANKRRIDLSYRKKKE